MKRVILGIHGLSNKPAEKTLERWWRRAIREGLAAIDRDRRTIPFELIYWADILYAAPLTQKVRNRRDPLFLKEPYARSHMQTEPEHSGMRMKMMDYIEGQLDKIFLNDDMTIHFKGIADQIIHRFALDLALYYGEDCYSLQDPTCTVQRAIQNRLLEKLKDYRGYKIMLIAHSMGSIVAFDVLWPLDRKHPVHRLITIGAPLGLPVITARIFADQKAVTPSIRKPHAPDCVTEQWLNLSDLGDKVALDHTLADDYGPNHRGIGALDLLVKNDYAFRGRANPHKSYGYLRTPQVARAIDDFLPDTPGDKAYRLMKRLRRKRRLGRMIARGQLKD